MSQSRARGNFAFEHLKTANPPKPALVGRAAEMERLASALSRSAMGQGHVLFVTGEAGIGKTRLVQEALSLARTRGFQVLHGRAFPLDSGLAYAPIMEVSGAEMFADEEGGIGRTDCRGLPAGHVRVVRMREG